MTGQTALPDDMVEVFSEKPDMSVLGLIKAGMGGLLMVALIIGWVRGTGQGQNLALLFVAAAGLIGMGVHDLAKVADRRAQVPRKVTGIPRSVPSGCLERGVLGPG